MNAPRPPVVPDALRDAYLARIGEQAAPPSVEALRALHRAHVTTIPHESTWIHLGETWDLDPIAAIERFTRGRGGYCYHLNGGFAALLHTLGYDVTWHSGAVHGGDDPVETDAANHLVLVVHGLPDDDSPTGDWYVDVGLGDGPLEPLPLRAGEFSQSPMTYTVVDRGDDAHRWRFLHDPERGNFPAMAFTGGAVPMDLFAAPHVRLSTDPSQSPFASMIMAFRRTPDGADALRNVTFIETRATRESRTIESQTEWFEVLADVFHLPLDDIDDERRHALYAKARAIHDAYVEQKAQESAETADS